MTLYYALTDGQTDTRSTIGRRIVQSLKELKDTILVFFVESHAIIGHRDQPVTLRLDQAVRQLGWLGKAAVELNNERAVSMPKLDGVHNQVLQQLPKPGLIAQYSG